MTREDIIRMAREAGMERVVKLHSDGTRTVELPHPDLLEAFANLVAAAEREVCAGITENWRCNGFPRTVLADQIRARGQG